MSAKAQAALKLLAMAGEQGSAAELRFFMVNRSLVAVPYDRASLWRIGRRKPVLVGVSGIERYDAKGTFAQAWIKTIRAAGGAKRRSTAQTNAAGKALAGVGSTVAALWLPLGATGMALAVERWHGDFDDADAALLTDLAAGYATAWRALGNRNQPRATGRILKLLALAALVAALISVRLPLRVVAPCEVVAKSPYLVATPMEGIIREVLVDPGQTVAAGQELALYQEDIQEGDLEVARRQVEAAEAELAALTIKSLTDASLRDRVRILGARHEQERARLDLAEKRFEKTRIVAQVSGTAQIDDPNIWRGRPVGVGEKLLWLVEPGRNRIQIWLSQADRVDFDAARPLRVHLDAYGGVLFEARLSRVGSVARMSPNGIYAFAAEAEWVSGNQTDALLGLGGTAVLYGQEVPLWWWLLRKPVGGVRKWLGL